MTKWPKKGVSSLEGNKSVLFFYFNESEIWLNKRACFWLEWFYKRRKPVDKIKHEKRGLVFGLSGFIRGGSLYTKLNMKLCRICNRLTYFQIALIKTILELKKRTV